MPYTSLMDPKNILSLARPEGNKKQNSVKQPFDYINKTLERNLENITAMKALAIMDITSWRAFSPSDRFLLRKANPIYNDFIIFQLSRIRPLADELKESRIFVTKTEFKNVLRLFASSFFSGGSISLGIKIIEVWPGTKNTPCK